MSCIQSYMKLLYLTSDLQRDIPRTWDKILDTLAALNAQGNLPDLSAVTGFQHCDDDTDSPNENRDGCISITE